jgi:leucyl-tRNA synthetase
MMFASPPEQTLEWSDASVEGAFRFLRRVWAFGHAVRTEVLPQLPAGAVANVAPGARLPAPLADIRREIHLVLRQANHDFGKFQFNTVASAAMKMLNALERAPREGELSAQAAPVIVEGLSLLLRLLSPITPHLTHVLWRELGYGEDILEAAWPEPDPVALEQDEIELVLQVNGKHRGSVRVPASASREEIERVALAAEPACRALSGAPPRRVVVVPGRLVNVVV